MIFQTLRLTSKPPTYEELHRVDEQRECQRIRPEAQRGQSDTARECSNCHDGSLLRGRRGWFRQLVDATLGLDYIHNLQFVHGDLKGVSKLSNAFGSPTHLEQANILATGGGRACLADFGLSIIVRATHQGTPDASDASLVSIAPGGTLEP